MQDKRTIQKHWKVLLICCFLSVTSIGLTINAGGVFFTPVAESFGVMRGTVAVQATINLLGTAIISLFVPRLMAKYSYKLLLYIGTFGAAITTILMAFVTNMAVFYLLGAIRGVCVGLFGMVPLTMMMNNWFEKHHGLVTSLVLGSSGIAGAIFSPIFATLIETFGWQTAYIVLGLIMFAFTLPALLFNFQVHPRDEDLLPYGHAEFLKAAENRPVQKRGKMEISLVTLILFLVFATLASGVTGIPHHFPGFADSIGYSATVGATMLSAGMISNIISKLFLGFLSDRVGAVKANFTMIAINIGAAIILLNGTNASVMLVGAFLFGSIFSVASVGKTLLTTTIFGIENYGTVYPFISFAGTMGGAFGMSIVGYIYDFTGSYMNAFIVAIVINALNLVLLIIMAKQALKKKKEAELLV